MQRADLPSSNPDTSVATGRRVRQLIVTLLALSLAIPLAGCGDQDNPDQDFVHIVHATQEPAEKPSTITLPSTPTPPRIASPTQTPETLPTQAIPTEAVLGRQPTAIIPEVSHFSEISFDISRLASADEITVESQALQGDSSWRINITTYDGKILVDLFQNGEYEVSFRLNSYPKRIEIKVQDNKIIVHAISADDVDLWGMMYIDPTTFFEPQQVTAKHTQGTGAVSISNIAVH